MNNLIMLVRREYWENRSLWIAPLIIAGIILVLALFGFINAGDGNFSFGTVDAPRELGLHDLADSPEKQRGIYQGVMMGFTSIQLLVLGIVIFFYLLDALLAERKDRSILFWKSLPISDTEVVGSKLLTALLVAPVFVLLVSAATQLLFGVIWWARMHSSPLGQMLIPFDAGAWLRVQGGTWMLAAATILWYAPLAAYLLLVSVWVRKNAFLWAVVPPVAILAIEGLLMHSHHFGSFLARRLIGVYEIIGMDSGTGGSGPESSPFSEFSGSVGAALVHWETWAGMAVAVALVVATIRIRRYRDDS